MSSGVTAWLVFGFLAVPQVWGALGLATGWRTRKALPILWGLLFGFGPLLLGIERVLVLSDCRPLAAQVVLLSAATIAFCLTFPRVAARLARPGVDSLMLGMLLMAGGALVGAFLSARNREVLSIAVGGLGFLFGATRFANGMVELRRR